ncbi:MAG: hypothetical protein ACR2N4_06910 [Jatrophihabitans sp.]
MTASTVRFCRTDPGASPAALVAAWLIDALAGCHLIGLSCADPELIQLDIGSPEAQLPIRRLFDTALTEARFAGWELACE